MRDIDPDEYLLSNSIMHVSSNGFPLEQRGSLPPATPDNCPFPQQPRALPTSPNNVWGYTGSVDGYSYIKTASGRYPAPAKNTPNTSGTPSSAPQEVSMTLKEMMELLMDKGVPFDDLLEMTAEEMVKALKDRNLV